MDRNPNESRNTPPKTYLKVGEPVIMLHLRMIPQSASSSSCNVQAYKPTDDRHHHVVRNRLISAMAAEPGKVRQKSEHHNVGRTKKVLLPLVSLLQLDLLSLSCLKRAFELVIIVFVSFNTIRISCKLNTTFSTVTEYVR